MAISRAVLESIWSSRPDLQRHFPTGTTDPRLWNWARTYGAVEHPLALGTTVYPESPEERADRHKREMERALLEEERAEVTPTYEALVRRLRRQLEEGEAEYREAKRRRLEDYETLLRRLGKEDKRLAEKIEEIANEQGLFYSGIKTTRQGRRQEEYAERLGEVGTAQTRMMSDYERRLEALRRRYREEMEEAGRAKAREEARLSRLAAFV